MSRLSDLADEFPADGFRKRRGRRRARRCPHGHEYTLANTGWYVRKDGCAVRWCRKCKNLSTAAWKERTGYRGPPGKPSKPSRIGRARGLLSRAAAVVDTGLATEIRNFLAEGKA